MIQYTIRHFGNVKPEKGNVPELSVDTIKCQGCTQSFESIGVESQAVDPLKQGLHVSRAPLLLLWGGLFDRPFDKLLNAAATEVSESAIHWVNHTILNTKNTM